MIIAVIASLLLLCVVVAVYVAIHRHVAWYLPPVSVAQLSRTVHQQTAMAITLRQELEKHLEDFKLMMEDLNQIHSVSMSAHAAMLQSVTSKSSAIVDMYGEGLFDDIIRDVQSQLSTWLASEIMDRTTRLAGEYVLLQTLDSLELDVTLDARFVRPEDLKEAIQRLLKYQFPKRQPPKSDADYARWFMEAASDRKKLETFIGEVGAELLTMQWNGKVALSMATAPAQPAGVKVLPNTPHTMKLVGN